MPCTPVSLATARPDMHGAALTLFALVSPTAALGATTALRDSGRLARQLEKLPQNPTPADVEKALRQYEKEMKVYAAQALQMSAAGGKVVFGFRGFEEVPEITLH